MDLTQFWDNKDEQPLDRIVNDGGMCAIFRKIACIGDSLSSGEFEGKTADGQKSYHDMFEYSWGQYIARAAGNTVYNFSRGGMTAQEYCDAFAKMNGLWDKDKACQAYIIALGVNDIIRAMANKEQLGGTDDVNIGDRRKNKPTFAGYYAMIIQRIREIQPKARIFLVTLPHSCRGAEREVYEDRHRELLYDFSKLFEYTYVVDLRKYAPVYDGEFKDRFYLGGHMNPMGYIFTAKIIASYIDYIIRHNYDDFRQVGFIGTDYCNADYKR